MFEGEGHYIPTADHQQLGEAPPEWIHGDVCSHRVFAILHWTNESWTKSFFSGYTVLCSRLFFTLAKFQQTVRDDYSYFPGSIWWVGV